MNYWKFLLNASVIIVLLTAANRLYGEWQKQIPAQAVAAETSSAELQRARAEYPKDITPVTAYQVIDMLEKPKAPVTLLYIYTSWCGYCKMVTPMLEKVANEYAAEKLAFVAVSFDNSPNRLASYMADAGHSERFGRYIVLPDDKRALTQGLRYKRMNFNGGFPYIAVLDGTGKPVGEGGSGADYPSLKDVIERALNHPTSTTAN